MLNFFRSVLPATGNYVLTVGTPKNDGTNEKWFRNYHADTLVELEQEARKFDAIAGKTVFYALGNFKDNLHEDGSIGRKQAESHMFKTLAFDVDPRDSKQNVLYADQAAMVTTTRSACSTIGLPEPVFVSSGYGIHCYYPLTVEIPSAIWTRCSRLLRDALLATGMALDTSKVCDSSMVLRPVGTTNKKNGGARPVRLLNKTITLFDPMVLEQVLTKFIKPAKAAKASKKSAVAEAILSNNFPPGDGKLIEIHCNQLRVIAQLGGDVSEPLWRLALGLAKHCIDPLGTSTRWSDKHPEYTPQATARKMALWETGPATCEKFELEDKAACKNCPHMGKINSPIALGHPDTGASDPVREAIQDHFALIVLKKIGVVDRAALAVRRQDEMAASLTVLSREDGSLLIQRLVRSDCPNDEYEGSRASQFMYHPATVCYQGVEFNPRETTAMFLNLWVGPTITPKQGEWGLIKEFLLVVICDGSEAAYFYLIRYIAHALQRPWEKPGTMIAMLGGEGIGKGTLARILRKIWTATFLSTHTVKPIVGDFNGALERSFWVFLDEAVFAGDRAGTSALKGLITEPTVYINEKNQPGRTIRSYHRFIAATNAEHFQHIDPDNRRDFMLKVSEARKGDRAYWVALWRAIDGGEVEAMVFDLLAMDLTGFDVRTKPNTKELTLQKLQSLPPFPRWWFDCISRGAIWEDGPDWPEFVSTQIVGSNFKSATQGIRTYKQVTDRDIKDSIRKVCPSAKAEQRMESNHRRRGFKLPTLDIARAEFEKFIGDTVDWE
jgi:hypothetical protein